MPTYKTHDLMLADSNSAPAPASAALGWSDSERRKLLVVDDDPGLLNLLRILLSLNYEVQVATNGEAGLLALTDFQPDLIILDLEMPVMNGRAFFREARARGIEAKVLILSAYGANPARRELGADGAMDKPFEPEQLLDVVAQLIDAS